jgi:Ca2+-binding EF-hand superfamily protein
MIERLNCMANRHYKVDGLNLHSQKNMTVVSCACLALCVGFAIPVSVVAADRNGVASSEYAIKRVAELDTTNDGTQQTLRLNFSPENRVKLRRALDDYARSADPEHKQIEERRRSMRESIEVRFLAIDKDNDGSIDRQEATESLPQVARHFNNVDTNQDGVITLDELVAAQSRSLEHIRASEALLEAQKLQDAETEAVNKRKNKQAVNGSRKSAL